MWSTRERKNIISLEESGKDLCPGKKDLRQLGVGRTKLMREMMIQKWGPSHGKDTAQKAEKKGRHWNTGWGHASICEAASLKA